jgi:hypothetical protein
LLNKINPRNHAKSRQRVKNFVFFRGFCVFRCIINAVDEIVISWRGTFMPHPTHLTPSFALQRCPGARLSVLLACLLWCSQLCLVRAQDEFGPLQTDKAVAVKRQKAAGAGVQLPLPAELHRAGPPAGGSGKTSASLPTTRYLVVQIEFNDAAAVAGFRQEGVFVFHSVGRFADVFVADEKVLAALAQRPEVRALEAAALVAVPPAPRPGRSRPGRGQPDAIVRGGYENLTGKGSIVAIVDSGVDFRHPDFITRDAAGRPASRLLYFWDTALAYRRGRGLPGPFLFPNRVPLGTLFTRDQLTAELRRPRPHSLSMNGTTIVIASQKGGVGKTSTTLSLAAGLAHIF